MMFDLRKIFAVPKDFLKSKIYSTKIAKGGPGFDDRPEHPSVQMNSSSPCSVPVER